MDRVSLEKELAQVANQVENGVEVLVGALSSLCTETQLSVLLKKLENDVE